MIIRTVDKNLRTIFEISRGALRTQNEGNSSNNSINRTVVRPPQPPDIQAGNDTYIPPKRHRKPFTVNPEPLELTNGLHVPDNAVLKIEYSRDFKINSDQDSVNLDFGLYEFQTSPPTAVWVLNAHNKLDSNAISTNREVLIKQLATFVNSWGIVTKKEHANPNINDLANPNLRVLVTDNSRSLVEHGYTAARPYPTTEAFHILKPNYEPDKLARFIMDVLCPLHRALDEVRIFGTTIWETVHSIYEEHNIPFEQRLTLREIAGNLTPQVDNEFNRQRIEDKPKLLRVIAGETGYSDNQGNPLFLRYFKEAIDEFGSILKLRWADRNDIYWIDEDSGSIMSDKVDPKEHLIEDSRRKTRTFNGGEFVKFAGGTANFQHLVLGDHFGYRKPQTKDQRGEFVPLEPRNNFAETMRDHEFEYNTLITDTQELGYELKDPRYRELGKKFADGYSTLHELLYSDFGLSFYDPESMEQIKLFLYQARKKLGLRTKIYYPPRAIDPNSVKNKYFQRSDFCF